MEVYVLPVGDGDRFAQFSHNAVPYTVQEQDGNTLRLVIPERYVGMERNYPNPGDGRDHFYLAKFYRDLDITLVIVRLSDEAMVQFVALGYGVVPVLIGHTITLTESFANTANAGGVVPIQEVISEEEARVRFS